MSYGTARGWRFAALVLALLAPDAVAQRPGPAAPHGATPDVVREAFRTGALHRAPGRTQPRGWGADAAGARALPTEDEKLTASDAAFLDAFGWSVATSNGVAVVGAPRGSTNTGAAYVFRYDEGAGTWVEEQKLTATDTEGGDGFGVSVAVSGGVAVVGAWGDDDAGASAGAAYVFRYDGAAWAQEQKLTASDGAANAGFGWSVAVSNGVAVVGAYGDDGGGADAGAAYVFRFDGVAWAEEQKLTAADAAAGDEFGYAVAVSGGAAVVGAWGDDDAGASAGAAYVFRYDGAAWAEEQKLTAADGAAFDVFGSSVAVAGDAVAVGAYLDDEDGTFAGAAYVFRYGPGAWAEEQKLTASDGAENDAFGWSVAVLDDVAVVGAPYADGGGFDAGAAYAFRYDGAAWAEEEQFTASDAAEEDFFGWSVATSNGVAFAGAFGDSDAGAQSGAAYVFGTPAVLPTCPAVALVLSDFLAAPSTGGAEHVEVTNAGASGADLSGCALTVFDPFTATVTWAAGLGAGALPAGGTHVLAGDGTGDQPLPPNALPDGPGALAVLAGPPPASGTAVAEVTGTVVAALVYIDDANVFGSCGGAVPCQPAEVGRMVAAVAGAVGAEGAADGLPEAAALGAAFPNPARGAFAVRYGLPAAGDARLVLFDVLGREVAVLADGPAEGGWHEARVAAGLAAGVYVARLTAGGTSAAGTVTVVR